jgi:predicted dehydrogenase
MSEKKGISFVEKKVNGKIVKIPIVGVGVIGTSNMAKAHINGYKQMAYIFWPPPALVDLVKICDISNDVAEEAAGRYGFRSYTDRWQDLIEDENVRVIENVGTNDVHAKPCIEAAKSGKDILCEKPLARNAEEAWEMLEAVKKYNVIHACGNNYRFTPALMLARKLIDEGKIGKIQHVRAQYLQDFINKPNFPLIWRLQKSVSGSGSLGDLGSHIIDLTRWLCGEPGSVQSIVKTFYKERPLPNNPTHKGIVDVDDAFISTVEFVNGAVGFFEASRCSNGRKNYEYIEISGELGSLYFSLENLNYLHVYLQKDEQEGIAGFRVVDVTELYHPYIKYWYYANNYRGWEDVCVHQAYEFMNAVSGAKRLADYVATFEDGYKAMVVCDAIIKSAETGKKEYIKY